MDISLETPDNSQLMLKNPNEHIFQTKQNGKEIDSWKIKPDNFSREPVLFEKISMIHLTRSQYVITSLL